MPAYERAFLLRRFAEEQQAAQSEQVPEEPEQDYSRVPEEMNRGG